MKRLLLFATATAVALSSCSKDEIGASVASQNVISFDTYAANSTKAVVTDLTQLKAVGFTVSSLKSNTSDTVHTNMANVAVAWTATDGPWTYSTTAYWPTDGTVDFVAISRKDTTTPHVIDAWSTGSPTLQYVTGSSASGQEDLVIAYSSAQSASTNNGTVALTFIHALSKIGIGVIANTTNPAVKFVLTSITLKGIETSGKATISYSSGTSISWADNNSTNTDTEEDMSFTLATTNKTIYGATTIPTDYQDVINDASATTDNDLIILPLTLPASNLEVKGQWYTTTDSDPSSTTATWNTLGSEVTSTIDLSTALTLAVNTSYTINLKVTPNLPIDFSVANTAWTWVDGGSVSN